MEELFYYYAPDPTNTSKEDKYKELLLDSNPKLVAIDTETVSLDDRTPVGIGIALDPDHAFYFPCDSGEPNPLIPWKLLVDPSVKKIYHNALFDMDASDVLAIQVDKHIDISNIADTALMARLLLKPVVQLESVAWEAKKQTEPIKSIMQRYNARTTLDVPEREMALHCLQDCQATFAIYELWKNHIDLAYHDREMEITAILHNMSKQGIAIDQDIRNQLDEKYGKEVEYYLDLCKGFGFNPGSSQQVGHILAKRGVMLPFNKNYKGRPTSYNTSEDSLEFVSDPMAALVLNYRHAAKLLSTYIKPLRGESRAYSNFHLDAVTGRVSSRKINMQNIPPKKDANELSPREMFVPDSGTWTDIDYSQIELRVLAYLSQDPDMIRVFEEGGDIHRETCEFMDIDRKIAKSVNFGMIYGGTANTLRETAKITSIAKCNQLINDWFLKYRVAGEWIRVTQDDGVKRGYVSTMQGRKMRLPIDEDSEDGLRRKAVNYPIQGSAAEIIKDAMIKCRNLPMKLQVHDELLFDGDYRDAISNMGLDSITEFSSPITIKMLERWE